MPFPRMSAFRMPLRFRFGNTARPFRSSNSQAWQKFSQQSQRRGYASASDAIKPSGSDLPWAIGAVVVTIPGTWYILQPSPSSHGDHHDEHHDEASKGEQQESSSANESEEDSKGDGSKELAFDADEKAEKKSEQSSDESEKGDGESLEPTKTGDSDSPIKGTKKEEPSAKGATKKRVDSDQSKTIDSKNVDKETPGEGPEPSATDKPSSAKPPAGDNKQSGKQAGISNTDTKHSTDPTEDGKSSTKPEGSPETAKSQGTVDPKRPQK